MAERTMLVCDICGKPAEQSVSFKVGHRSRVQDLCATHLRELIGHSRAARRGRPRGPGGGRPKSSSSAKGRGRRSASSPRKTSTAKSRRGKITNPATLAKRREALAKAREALAKKRAREKAG